MSRCELCGKTIAGTLYLIGIKEIPGEDMPRAEQLAKSMMPKKKLWKPVCRACVDITLDSIEAMRQ